MDEKKLNNLNKLLDAFDEDRITTKDFVSAFQKVIEHVKGTQDLTVGHLTSITKAVHDARATMQSGNQEQFETLRSQLLSHVEERAAALHETHAQAVAELQEALASVKDGKDADEEVIIGKVLAKLPPPPQPESVDDIRQAIEELHQKLKDHDKRITSTGHMVIGNTPGTGVATTAAGILGRFQNLYFPGATITTNNTDATITLSAGSSATWRTITGTIDGTNVTFTIPSGGTTSGSILSLNGSIIDPTTDYSISGTTLTYVVAPVAGSTHKIYF